MSNNKSQRLYSDGLGIRNKMTRGVWYVTRGVLFKPFRGPLFRHWRIFLLRCFGADIGRGCKVEASCTIWWPGNLVMGNYACLADSVDCYNVSKISIGDYATVSQRAFLCSASHATDTLARPLIHEPIKIEPHAWICAESFIGPGVVVHEGAVLGARGLAARDLEAWTIYAGSPARRLKTRDLR